MRELKTIVFGLSGNPPTENHLLFIQYLLSLKPYDLVRVVLNAHSPLKSAEDYLAPEKRFNLLKAMLQAASIDFRRCILERLEIDSPGPSRMIDTLKALVMRAKQQAIHEKITLVLGLDALKQFTDWYQWTQYGRWCEIKFYPRADVCMSDTEIAKQLQYLHQAGVRASVVLATEEKPPMVAGSASHARAYYASGARGIPEGITASVDRLIREHGYYGAAN